MYRTCIFCQSDLGANETIEAFPVGRRLAFDPARGRLWVVCRRCERWNLSGVEERWEGIEQMERLFRGTRLRASTSNIGLARLREGVELVRIGAPHRPELAAWRYGDQFGRRRRRAMLRAGAGIGVITAVVAGGMMAGASVGAFWWFGRGLIGRAVNGSPQAVVARLPDGPVSSRDIRRRDLRRVRLLAPGSPGDWRLVLPLRRLVLEYSGDEAVRAAGRLLPAMNRYGGTRQQVADAVDLLERTGDPLAFFGEAARLRTGGSAPVTHLEYPVRLALEMAAHEEQERRALEGELALLERAWREAEDVAAIADRLLVPTRVDVALERIRASLRR
jgi:hypothetical protein